MERQPVEDLGLYVDVEDALRRVCGNKAIYKKLLGKFRASLQIQELLAKADGGDLDAAAKFAHNIKGVTANLSLPAAYKKCVEVEAELKAGVVNKEELRKFAEILDTTLLCTDYVAETLV